MHLIKSMDEKIANALVNANAIEILT